jgi:hypothetical protein
MRTDIQDNRYLVSLDLHRDGTGIAASWQWHVKHIGLRNRPPGSFASRSDPPDVCTVPIWNGQWSDLQTRQPDTPD